MKNLQTVYLPTKVNDDRTPEFYNDRLFLLKGDVRDVGNYLGDSVFYSQVATQTTTEVTNWLKQIEGYFFTDLEISNIFTIFARENNISEEKVKIFINDKFK
jgi:hypothetical protein